MNKTNNANTAAIPVMATIPATAAKFGLAEYYVRTLVIQGKIKYVRAGKKYLINEASLIEYLNNGESE
jgi:excisionase family DNA binding protein